MSEAVEQALGCRVTSLQPLSRSWGLKVMRAGLDDDRTVLVKQGPGDLPGHAGLEGWMLGELARETALPVPDVLHASPDLLVTDWIDNEGGPSSPAHERHAAELLAALHTMRQPSFGYSRDTAIGGLAQPNPESASWVAFFRDHRLVHMADIAHGRGRLPGPVRTRIDRLADRLADYLDEPGHPSLLHGDLWGGNVLVRGERIAAVIDPAISCGHPEIELAFTTLFATFGRPFFDAYGALAPLDKEFFTLRLHIYNLYPLLVHVALFGGSYVPPVEATLERAGC